MNNMQKISEMSNYHDDNCDSKYNTPVLFEKKSKQNIVKPLSHINSDTGKTRHFTPAAQE